MSNYYTPEIEEFYQGFEYYTPVYNSTELVKCIFDTTKTPKYSWNMDGEGNITYPNDFLKVKYLDQEDIESLGFTIETTSYGIQYRKNKTFIKFSYDKKLIIEKYFNDFGSNSIVFIGDIKNKSELKKLLKQLNIE